MLQRNLHCHLQFFYNMHTTLSGPRRTHHTPNLCSWWFSSICHCEIRIHHIWEVDFTLTHTPEVVKSLPIPDNIDEVAKRTNFLFLPTTSQLAIALKNTLLIWDAQGSKLLLRISPFNSERMSFSSDGRFFACSSSESKVYVRKESPNGYILHQHLAFPTFRGSPIPLLSPNGESIVTSPNSAIHLWHTKDPIPPSSDPTLTVKN